MILWNAAVGRPKLLRLVNFSRAITRLLAPKAAAAPAVAGKLSVSVPEPASQIAAVKGVALVLESGFCVLRSVQKIRRFLLLHNRLAAALCALELPWCAEQRRREECIRHDGTHRCRGPFGVGSEKPVGWGGSWVEAGDAQCMERQLPAASPVPAVTRVFQSGCLPRLAKVSKIGALERRGHGFASRRCLGRGATT